MAEGRPQKQSVAIAMRQAGRPKPGVKGKPKKVGVPRAKKAQGDADEPGTGY